MKKETRVWIRKNFSGFAAAGIVSFILWYFWGMQYHSWTMVFVYIVTMVMVEYIHNNPINYGHIMMIFFWIFYAKLYNGNFITASMMSIAAGALASIIPIAVHWHFYLKDDHEEKSRKIREEKEYREKLKKIIAAYTGMKEYDIDVLLRY